MKKAIALVTVNVFIITAYVWILILSFNPNVPIEYELYYIKHLTGTLHEEGSFRYNWGDEIFVNQESLTAQHYLAQGWAMEVSGAWSVDDSAYIIVEVDDNENKDIKLELDAIACKFERELKVFFDGKYITNIVIDEKGKSYSIDIDSKYFDVEGKVHTVQFEFMEEVEPCNLNDQRTLVYCTVHI